MAEKFYCVKCRTKFESDDIKVKFKKTKKRNIKFHTAEHPKCGTMAYKIVG